MTDSPTTCGLYCCISRSTVGTTRSCTRMRSATDTWWPGPALPASEASAPFGIRMVSAGVCSNESGIERRRTLIAPPGGAAYNQVPFRATTSRGQ